MKKVYKKFIKIICIICLLFIYIQPLKVQADAGPKPSAVIEFEGVGNEQYYVTLLSETESTGPWSTGSDYEEWMENEAVWEQFHSYTDEDGFYFLGYFEDCSVTDRFAWTYYPPETFKILIYFPETDRFIVSEIYERYAFDSYFTMEVISDKVAESQEEIWDTKVEKSYDYTWEIVSLIFRIIITILIELLVALLFGFHQKKQLLWIAGVNILTQTILNIALNLANYYNGSYAFVFHYIWIEILVFVIEGVIYTTLIQRLVLQVQGKKHPWLYALCANIASFVAGLVIANVVPGIF